MQTIDLRSDTVSHPTPAMREAMFNAVVGDDVYGEDPTVNALQEYAADLLGKEAALYCTSGTQGNVISVLTHCQRGDELIVGKQAHIFQWEAGAASVLGGISMNTLPVHVDGTLSLDDIRLAIRADDSHLPRTRLICLENTQGGVGGVPITADYTAQVGEFAHSHGLQLHIDGARLFNAAAALEVHPRELVKHADSVQICLSKGLCAPVGSLVVGSRDFIKRAHRNRKILGGAMRQAGVIAAAGLVALRDMRERMREDHDTAQLLTDGLATIAGITLHPISRRTNMVLFSIPESMNNDEFVAALKAKNIILRGGPHFRAVTHYWITPAHIQLVVETVRDFMAEHSQQVDQAADIAAGQVIY
ncbi:MAG: low-specificity L-threonine aldolase [Chloroflexota bacterium]